MSAINTNALDVNYPVPGQNNSTQGFRNNFSTIKTNLNTAGTEITDLQNKAVLKSALANTTINNDMANTLISNCATLGFRATTYNLGNALSGTVLVNAVLGDVQYGTVAANTTFNFGSWAPTNTLSQVQLRIGISNANATITFSGNLIANNNFGSTILENFVSANGFATITAPYDVTQINLIFSSTDCGNSIYVEPVNRPFKSTQIQERTPLPTGFQGDKLGTVAVDTDYLYVCTADYDATIITGNAVSTETGTNLITFDTNVQSAGVSENMPVIFDTMTINNNSVTSFGNIDSGAFYFVKSVSGNTITISDSRANGIAGSTLALTTQAVGSNTYMDATFYNGSDIWKRVNLSSW